MQWKRREALFFQGAPLALIPALCFLPVFAYLILTPCFPHAPLVALAAFPALVVAEVWGLIKLVRCCRHEFDLLTVLSFGVFVVLAVIATYTGFWLAALVLGGSR
jgi:hypothetical protein